FEDVQTVAGLEVEYAEPGSGAADDGPDAASVRRDAARDRIDAQLDIIDRLARLGVPVGNDKIAESPRGDRFGRGGDAAPLVTQADTGDRHFLAGIALDTLAGLDRPHADAAFIAAGEKLAAITGEGHVSDL